MKRKLFILITLVQFSIFLLNIGGFNQLLGAEKSLSENVNKENKEYGFFDGLFAPAEAMVNLILTFFGDDVELSIISDRWQNGNFLAKIGIILGVLGILLLIGGAGLRTQMRNFSSNKGSVESKNKDNNQNKWEDPFKTSDNKKEFCPRGCGELIPWQGKLRCWKCGWPVK